MITMTLNGKDINIKEKSLISEVVTSETNMPMPCAGKGKCGKCKVYAKGDLSPVSENEKIFLSNDEVEKGIRLACCTKILGKSDITLIETSINKIQSLGVMPKFEHNKIFGNYGVAIDIGTTTLVAQLYSESGVLSQSMMVNPQMSYGSDVISRIEVWLQGDGYKLAKCIREAISKMLTQLTFDAKIDIYSIDTIVITGNTTMLYLLTNSNPKCLSHAPFEPDRLFGEFMSASYLDLPCENAKVYIPRCISAFVGADITTAILASDICNNKSSTILVDIGTNGEIVLWSDGELYCCSTAAGPAFEGVGISIGMNAKDGAIDHVDTDNEKLVLSVIGDMEATGICGSGIIDLLACFLQLEMIDETGSLDNDSVEIAKNLAITQKDIRAVQLAKSAISSGIQTLMNIKEVEGENDITLKIAGGFGSYINIENAAKIGLFPKSLVPKTEIVGNVALSGAVMILLNADFINLSDRIAKSAKTIDLSKNKVFMDFYIENMMFN